MDLIIKSRQLCFSFYGLALTGFDACLIENGLVFESLYSVREAAYT
jgi:hypothetical protein